MANQADKAEMLHEMGAAYFTPALEDMINDSFLGLSLVAPGLVIWVVRLLILDPKGSVKAALRRTASSSANLKTGP